ncbi:MAG: isoleucine--tRNA ligase [Bacteroidetes bacterium]|nr:isoleucine--tRNA ligase [Bacteroidota bacterium]
MTKYREFKKIDFPTFEQEILNYWKEKNIFEKSIENRKDAKPFVFFEGPPSANGMPGIHHVMARAVKDTFCRYKTLQGFKVDRKGGWDTHGLPVELQVEKELNITKEDIGKSISIEEYNQKCKETVMRYKQVWDELTERIGFWVDLDNPYITYENDYIESLWYLLKMLYNKGLLYKGYTIQPFSPAAGTGLSSHELNQPGTYKPVKDMTAVAMFKALSSPNAELLQLGSTVYFLAWTTTPWTLPSNTALAVGKNINYLVVKTLNPFNSEEIVVVLANDLVLKYFKEEGKDQDFSTFKVGDKIIPWTALKEFKGSELAGTKYEQLLPYAQPDSEKKFEVIVGDFVTTEDGTGIVHIAPSFGADDFRVAKQNNIGALTLVDRRGKFTEEVTDFAHEYVKEQYLSDAERASEIERLKSLPQTNALNKLISQIVNRSNEYLSMDDRIVLKLQLEGKLFKKEKYEHTYPHCWRTDKPILYYPLDSWFIKSTAVKDRMVELNKTINWKPESTGTGRFGNWLENLQDWNLSRSRYWGTPLPIWRTEDDSEEICIGSIAELKAEVEKANKALNLQQVIDDKFELHRPYVDAVVLVSKTGLPMKRELDLIDVWFDSGAMPYAQWHWMGGEKQSFPADFIAEGVDQTRGWFFTLHALSVMLFDSVAYKNVISNGLVLDKNGQKMSKRLGNVINPTELIDKHGVDAVRWYMLSNSDPWDNLKFDSEGVAEVQRKLFGTLYNTYSFYSLYANVDGFVVDEKNTTPVAERHELDRWILSKLNSLVKNVSLEMEDYEPTKAARLIEDFVDRNLSNWYVRLNRRRFWKGEMSDDKKAAYETLHECLATVSQLMSPIAPFFTDLLYKNLHPTQETSVHLSNWPVSNPAIINVELERSMELAQNACSLILSIRKKMNIKVRQPLQKVMIPVLDEQTKNFLVNVIDIIQSEVNVKEVLLVDDSAIQLVKKIKPNFKLLGARLGAKMKVAAQIISEFSQDQIRLIEQQGNIEIQVENEPFLLSIAEVEISSEDIPGWQVALDSTLTVALDINITEDLKNEGLARELINRLQNQRKEKNYEVTDKIIVHILRHKALETAIQQYGSYICNEILAEELISVDQLNNGVDIEVDEIKTSITIDLFKN